MLREPGLPGKTSAPWSEAAGGKGGARAPVSSLVQSRSCLVPCALGCYDWPSRKGWPLFIVILFFISLVSLQVFFIALLVV